MTKEPVRLNEEMDSIIVLKNVKMVMLSLEMVAVQHVPLSQTLSEEQE